MPEGPCKVDSRFEIGDGILLKGSKVDADDSSWREYRTEAEAAALMPLARAMVGEVIRRLPSGIIAVVRERGSFVSKDPPVPVQGTQHNEVMHRHRDVDR